LLERAGAITGGQPADPGVVALAGEGASNFLGVAARGRVWDREPMVRRVY